MTSDHTIRHVPDPVAYATDDGAIYATRQGLDAHLDELFRKTGQAGRTFGAWLYARDAEGRWHTIGHKSI